VGFCGIQQKSHARDDSFVDRLSKPPKEKYSKMHDILIALAFIAMVLAPALVAAKAGKEAAVEESD
jgi:hypothetical protein